MSTPRPVALVTGASGGIGLELARLCAKGGHDLILVARRQDKLEEVAKYLSGMYRIRAEVIVADLARPEAPAEVLAEVERRGMTIDVLVNNAGVGLWGLFGRQETEQVLGMLQLNITSLTHLTRLVLPGMVHRRRGRILNVGSAAGFAPGPLMAVYYGTKAYVLHFSEAIANELARAGLEVAITGSFTERSAALFSKGIAPDSRKCAQLSQRFVMYWIAPRSGCLGRSISSCSSIHCFIAMSTGREYC